MYQSTQVEERADIVVNEGKRVTKKGNAHKKVNVSEKTRPNKKYVWFRLHPEKK